MNLAELARLVVEMRRAQRAYFRTRTREDLQLSKALEKRVDEACAAALAPPAVLPLFPTEGGPP